MPSKLKKALRAVKDQTSLSLAKVAKSNSVEVVVLKATSHDDDPVDERHVLETINLVSSDEARAKSCAYAIVRRIRKTKSWVVTLKSLLLFLRIVQNDVFYLSKEVLRGVRCDDSSSSPLDHAAFVRSFANYLHDRLECHVTGRLDRDPVREMKPVVLLDKIVVWQRMIDRAISAKPAGSAKNNRLIQNSLSVVVSESFDLYSNVSDGLTLLLDSFFHLPSDSRAGAFKAFVKASEQFGELSEFYDTCKEIGVGKTSEYPKVQNLSEELLDTLREFLKDQSSPSPSPSPKLLPPAPAENRSDECYSDECYSDFLRGNDDGSSCSVPADQVSVSNSVLDPVSLGDDWAQPDGERRGPSGHGHGHQQSWEIVLFDESKSCEPKQCVDILSHATPSQRWTNPFLDELMSSLPSTPQNQENCSANISGSFGTLENQNDPFSFTTAPNYDDDDSAPTLRAIPNEGMARDSGDENLALQGQIDLFAATTPSQSHITPQMSLQNDLFALAPQEKHNIISHNDLFALATTPPCHNITQTPLHNNNPFAPITELSLHTDLFVPATPSQSLSIAESQLKTDLSESHSAVSMQLQAESDPFSDIASTREPNNPTFKAASPTFVANEPNNSTPFERLGDDPFGATTTSEGQGMSHEQMLWLENQNKIIGKHKT